MSEPEFKTFLCEYPFDGGVWCFEIKAASRTDAEARMKQMPFARVCGEAMFKVKVAPNWLGRLFGKKQATGED